MGDGTETGGAGNESGGAESGWNDENISGLWGWLNGFADKLENVRQSIVSLPSLIVDGIKSFLLDIKDAILLIPNLIIDGIKEIFIPDTEDIETSLNALIESLNVKFNNGYINNFKEVFNGERPIEDIKSDYTIPNVGTFNLTFLDTKYLTQGIGYFRSLLRGVLVFLLILYNIRQLISFFGYDSGIRVGFTGGSDTPQLPDKGGKL